MAAQRLVLCGRALSYVIVGGILFALFAAFYYWYPKFTGACWTSGWQTPFLAVVIGFTSASISCTFPDARYAPRIYTFEPGRGGHSELLVTIGASSKPSPYWCRVDLSFLISEQEAGNDPGRLTLECPPPLRRPLTLCFSPNGFKPSSLVDIKHPKSGHGHSDR